MLRCCCTPAFCPSYVTPGVLITVLGVDPVAGAWPTSVSGMIASTGKLADFSTGGGGRLLKTPQNTQSEGHVQWRCFERGSKTKLGCLWTNSAVWQGRRAGFYSTNVITHLR